MPNYSAWENDRRTPDPDRQASALAALAVIPPPTELASVLHAYQQRMAEASQHFAADLLRAADEDRYLLIADALRRMPSPVSYAPATDAAAQEDAARLARGEPALTPPEQTALQYLEGSARLSMTTPARAKSQPAKKPARKR